MKHAFRLVAGTALLVLGTTLGGCHTSDSSGQAAQAMELKMYHVPVAQSEELRNALTQAMASKASVSQAAPGQLLVYAPRDAQASIGEAIEALGKAVPKQAPAMQVGVHFWVIDGQPGAGADDPALKNLAGSLASLQQSMGPLHFHLDQAATLVGVSGQTGNLITADGPHLRDFDFRVGAVNGDTARLQLGYQDSSNRGLGKLNTEVDATFGQYLVLAMAPGACPTGSSGVMPTNTTCQDKPALRLLVVRVDRLPAKA
ncbi:MAG: hypothetical protein RSP_03990 [Rhodanobacter sp.]